MDYIQSCANRHIMLDSSGVSCDMATDNIIKSSIPALKENVYVSSFDDGNHVESFLISYENRNWQVSKLVYLVVNAIDGKKNIQDLMAGIYSEQQLEVKEEDIDKIIEFLQENGLNVSSEKNNNPGKSNKMLWGRITLLPAKYVEKLAIFNFFFYKNILIVFSLAVLAWLIYMYLHYSSSAIAALAYELSIKQIILCYLFCIISGFFHEFGHSIALLKNGVKPGRIGVGVYFFMPVLFSDVTNAWRLKRGQRVIVDAGGVYLQGLFLLVLYFINYFLIHNSILHIGILASAFQIVFNFNPFIKMDGYWILCDSLGSTDVFSTTSNLWLNMVRKKDKKDSSVMKLSRGKKTILYVYSIFTVSFFIYFIRIMVDLFNLALQTIVNDIAQVQDIQFGMLQVTDIIYYVSTRFSSIIIVLFAVIMIVRLLRSINRLVIKKVVKGT